LIISPLSANAVRLPAPCKLGADAIVQALGLAFTIALAMNVAVEGGLHLPLVSDTVAALASACVGPCRPVSARVGMCRPGM